MKRFFLCLIGFLLFTGCGAVPPEVTPSNEVPAGNTEADVTETESPQASAETESAVETEAPFIPNYPEVFSAAEYDLEDIRTIVLTSGMTNKSLTLTKGEEVEALAAAVKPLVGTDPISSHGYYGYSFRIVCYGSETDGRKNGILDIVVTASDVAANVILNGTLFEYVNDVKGRYPAMYTIDLEAGRALVAACREYLK